jgi:hypothetical protein
MPKLASFIFPLLFSALFVLCGYKSTPAATLVSSWLCEWGRALMLLGVPKVETHQACAGLTDSVCLRPFLTHSSNQGCPILWGIGYGIVRADLWFVLGRGTELKQHHKHKHSPGESFPTTGRQQPAARLSEIPASRGKRIQGIPPHRVAAAPFEPTKKNRFVRLTRTRFHSSAVLRFLVPSPPIPHRKRTG